MQLFPIQSGLPAQHSHVDPAADRLSRDSPPMARTWSLGSDTMSRSTSLNSDILATDSSMLLDTCDILTTTPLSTSEKWRNTFKLVQKSQAFSKDFKMLKDTSGQDTIDPARLTKIKEAGQGAFATVDVCWLKSEKSSEPPSQVAVKRLKYEALRHRSDLERFFKEAAMLKSLRHRSISGYVGVGNFSEGTIESMPAQLTPADAKAILKSTFIVQEYIPGGTLKDLVIDAMMRRKKYTDEQACAWMQQIAEGLLYLHTSDPKVMHRDLKLENILMRDLPKGGKEACLADFGISVLLPSDGKAPRRSSSRTRRRTESFNQRSIQPGSQEWKELSTKLRERLSSADAVLAQDTSPEDLDVPVAERFELTAKTGSFMYMAPEVFAAQQYNEKADVFSFGCILHEVFARLVLSTLVVGPTGNPSAAKVFASKVADGYRRPLPGSMPLQVQHLIADCWAQDAAERPDMEAVVSRLDALAADGALVNGTAANGKPESSTFSSCTGCCIM